MTKFYDAVYSFERVGGLSIRKALHINVWEMAWVTAMAAGGEQTRSAHARDVSLGARINTETWSTFQFLEICSAEFRYTFVLLPICWEKHI